jgi:hypothetical protein
MHRRAAIAPLLIFWMGNGPYDRLPVSDGPVPGAPSLVVTSAPDPTRCGGVAVTVRATRARGRPPVDPELVAALTLDGPRGLDFDAAHPDAQRASTAKLGAWLTAATRSMQAAIELYQRRAADKDAPPDARVEAMAHIAQVERRFAEVIARMEIPRSVRTGPYAADATRAFCEALADKAEPLVDQADEAAAACRKAAADARLPAGWWDDVCRAPTRP